MILCVGTTPAAQRVMIFPRLNLNEVNRAAITLDGAAGKSLNVAKVLQVFGAEPLATGFLGSGRGDPLRAELATRGVASDFIDVPVPARECITVIDQASGQVTELVEESRPVANGFYEQLIEKLRSHVAGCRAIIMSGSLTPGGPPDFYRRCTELAATAGVLSVVDAQGIPLVEALKVRPGLVKPNRRELAATVGRELPELPEVVCAMQELIDRGAQRVVVTAGPEPVLASDGNQAWQVFPPTVAALNPIGSGDAFTAALVWRLLEGDDLGRACRWGAATAAANALTPMPGDLERADVERLFVQTRVELMTSR